jgi:hypothetical protein
MTQPEEWGQLGLDTEQAVETPGDFDLGEQLLLKRKERQKPYYVFGSSSIYHTENVALVKEGKQADLYFLGQVGASYRPRITDTLYGEATVNQAMFRYDEFSEMDFDSFNAGGGLTWVMTDLWDIMLFTRYNYNRLTYARANPDGPGGSEFYVNHSVESGLQKIFVISKAHAWYIGHTSTISAAEPDPPERDEFAIYTGYTVDLTRSLNLHGIYSFAYVPYAEIDRNDLDQAFTLTLNYRIADWISLSTGVSYLLTNSDNEALNYEDLST